MPDPSDTNLAGLHFWKERARASSGALCKQRRNPNAGGEIELCPIAAGTQFHPGRFFRGSVRRLANYLSLSRKRVRHCRATIYTCLGEVNGPSVGLLNRPIEILSAVL